MAIPAHRILQRVGRTLASQWKKTLNLSVVIRSFGPGEFVSASRSGKFDFIMEVVDLDNGSMQDLWAEGTAGIPFRTSLLEPDKALDKLENAWLSSIPHLPLIGNRHFTVGPGNAGKLAALCPGCRFVGSGDIRRELAK